MPHFNEQPKEMKMEEEKKERSPQELMALAFSSLERGEELRREKKAVEKEERKEVDRERKEKGLLRGFDGLGVEKSRWEVEEDLAEKKKTKRVQDTFEKAQKKLDRLDL